MRKFLLIISILLTMSSGALGHSWYSASCCSGTDVGGDCHPIKSCDEITEDLNGLYWHGFHFYKWEEHPSQDDMCHVCISTESNPSSAVTHCIYTIPKSF